MTFEKPLHATQHCRHYSYEHGGDGGPCCAAGIDLRAPDTWLGICMPPRPTAPSLCAWREEFTPAEDEAWERWFKARTLRMAAVMAVIPGDSTDRKNKPEWGNSGSFACPACEVGTVKWVRASSNGHLHAACSTPGCFVVHE
jgi:hypothetical protein